MAPAQTTAQTPGLGSLTPDHGLLCGHHLPTHTRPWTTARPRASACSAQSDLSRALCKQVNSLSFLMSKCLFYTKTASNHVFLHKCVCISTDHTFYK